MSFLESIGLEVAKDVAKRLLNGIFQKHQPVLGSSSDLEKRIADHITFVANISERIEFYGLSEAKRTDRDTVDLFVSLPRKFSAAATTKTTLSESRLLTGTSHYVLLGAPGAGKTTTLKRLARRILTRAPQSPHDHAQYPLFIRLRELSADYDLPDSIGSIFGFTDEPTWRQQSGEPHVRYAARRARILAALADASGALVLLDGLDEVPAALRPTVERDITTLAELCRAARLVVTCRSGDYNAQLRQFDALELSPLQPKQIERIARRWAHDPDRFLSTLRDRPFLDLASRPLFLCQLLMIFRLTDSIPEQPTDVVERIIRLAIEEWDERHKLQPRRSSYAGFDSARKRDFLAHLAFWQMYREERYDPLAPGTTDFLVRAYHEIHERFGLPKNEAELVARELETHTGIFVEVGRHFEFSHLSLQEYLAGSYLVRQPISYKFSHYISHPGPVAIAAVLSSAPELWLAELLLTGRIYRLNLRGFFARLNQERPSLVRSEALGFAAIAVATHADTADEFLSDFLLHPQVQRSIKCAAAYYTLKKDDDHRELLLREKPPLPIAAEPLSTIRLSAETFRKLEERRILRRSDMWRSRLFPS